MPLHFECYYPIVYLVQIFQLKGVICSNLSFEFSCHTEDRDTNLLDRKLFFFNFPFLFHLIRYSISISFLLTLHCFCTAYQQRIQEMYSNFTTLTNLCTEQRYRNNFKLTFKVDFSSFHFPSVLFFFLFLWLLFCSTLSSLFEYLMREFWKGF